MATKSKKQEGAAVPPSIPEVVTKESLKVVETKSASAVEQGGKIVVKTEEDLAKASEFLSNIKSLQKFVKQEKDKRLNPIKETKAWVEGLFKPIEERIEQAEAGVKRLMAAYHDKKEAENARKAAQIAAQAEKGKIKEETAVRKLDELGEVKTNVKTTAGSSTFSKIKKVRVINPELQKGLLAELFKRGPKEIVEKLVPAAYWVIDEVTLRAASLTEAKTQNKLGELIPGAEVYEETVVGGR